MPHFLIFKESEVPESDNVVKEPLDMPKIEDSSEIKSPTSRSTPRIHDMAKENHKEADKENERQKDNEVFVEEKEIRKKDDLNQDKKESKTNEEVHTECFYLKRALLNDINLVSSENMIIMINILTT